MCSRFSTRRPRLCTIWTAVAPEAVFTRRTKAPTPRDYPRRQAPLVTTSAPIHGQTPTSAAPTITRSPERYKSGLTDLLGRAGSSLREVLRLGQGSPEA